MGNFLNVTTFLAGINLLKAHDTNTKKKCEIYSKLTIKMPERRHWRRFGVFIVSFEHISYLVLVFLLLTLNILLPAELLLLLNLTISTRRSKLKTYKNANQFDIPHNITETGPRNIEKITTNNETFLLLYPKKS